MFEEICLVCGKYLQDDGRAYCGDDCQSTDLASPSISSSSSALSSPQLGYAQGLADVPVLVPSALGSALRKVQSREPYCVNPAASSSNPWGLSDDDESAPYARGAEYLDPMYEGSSKSANYIYNMMPSALSYARRPSGTNTHSLVPQIKPRNSGTSPAPQKRATARSFPNPSHSSTDDDALSEYSLFAVDDSESDKDQPYAGSQLSSSSRRNRKRTSLPACFSLLQISTSSGAKPPVRTSPDSSSSARTIARISPPTPKYPNPEVAIANWQHPHLFVSQRAHDAPRGRWRDDDRSSRRSDRSSPSRSRSRHVRRPESPRPISTTRRGRTDSRENGDHVFDLDDAGPPRGRTSARRNSSPPARMLMGMDDPARLSAAIRDAERYERSKSNSKSRAGRGRVAVNELNGVGTGALAPGYGNGRSGLMDRERYAALRVPL